MSDDYTKRRRILISGLSRFRGTGLASLLERLPEVEQIVAIDKHGPVHELARTDIIQADLNHTLIRKLVRQLNIDTVVHTTVSGNTMRRSQRLLHDANVIGTMNVLAGCGGNDSPVRHVILLADTAIYGGGPKNPALWSEYMSLPAIPKSWYERDLREVERYAKDFRALQSNITVTVLRLADVVGQDCSSLMAKYLTMPAIPTVFGFDPVLQLLHQDDALEALRRATMEPHAGTFNVAGRGVIPVSQAIAIMGKMNIPVIPFAGQELAVQMALRPWKKQFPQHFLRFIKYGWTADTKLWEKTWGIEPRYTSLETVQHMARVSRTKQLSGERVPYVYEAQLEEFLRRKGQGEHPPAVVSEYVKTGNREDS